MKKLVIVFLLISTPLWTFAQDLSKYAEMDEVEEMTISKSMFKMISQFDLKSDDPDIQRLMKMLDNLDDIKVLSTTNQDIGLEMKKDAGAYANSSNLEELLQTKKSGKDLTFFGRPSSNPEKMEELFLIMTDGEDKGNERVVVLSITGDIDLNEIGHLAGVLDHVPGIDELDEVKPE